MTLPVELLQRRRSDERYDAVIVGAGIAGLVAATMLARAGLRVVVVESSRRPGGSLQTLAYQGYAVDVGEVLWQAAPLAEALTAAGVTGLGLAEIQPQQDLRIGLLRDTGAPDGPWALPVPGAMTSPATLDAVRSLYGAPPRVFAAVAAHYEELASADVHQLEEWRETSLAAYLAERDVEPSEAAAVKRSASLLGAHGAESVSVATLAARARELRDPKRPAYLACGDDPVGGARSLVQALVDALVDAGGELRLGTTATGMAVDAKRFAALAVHRREIPFVDEIVADRCVLAISARASEPLVPADLRAPLERGEGEAERWQTVALACAVRQAAELIAGGEAKVLRLLPEEKPVDRSIHNPRPILERPVTVVLPTRMAPRLAPPGHELVLVRTTILPGQASDARAIASVVGHLRAALRGLLVDLRERTQWERYWIDEDFRLDPLGAGAWPLALPSCDGVFLAGEHVAVPAVFATGVAAEAAAGRAVAERILT